MRAAHTARLKGVETTKNGAITTVVQATGELNFDENATHIRALSRSGSLVFDLIAIGKRGWGRGSHDVALQPEWCALDLTELVDPGAVLKSLDAAHAQLQRVGDETVDTVTTTHYRTVLPDFQPAEKLDLWVDANDRLRRLIDRTGDNTQSADLYDFGARIAPIRAPSTKDCAHPGTSGSGSATP